MDTKATITTVSNFIEQQSNIESNRFVYSYKITIENTSKSAIQLLSRHWVIQDANQKIEEVYGDGVVGEQPVIQPGESYSYTSGAVLETDLGTMEGRYFMINKEKDTFEVPIPKFLLSVPRTIH